MAEAMPERLRKTDAVARPQNPFEPIRGQLWSHLMDAGFRHLLNKTIGFVIALEFENGF